MCMKCIRNKILAFIQNADMGLRVPNIQEKFGVSRQYVSMVLKELIECKKVRKLKRGLYTPPKGPPTKAYRTKQRILSCVNSQDGIIPVKEIARSLGIAPCKLRFFLNLLSTEGKIQRIKFGKYSRFPAKKRQTPVHSSGTWVQLYIKNLKSMNSTFNRWIPFPFSPYRPIEYQRRSSLFSSHQLTKS